jgi:hypothetical protein
METKQFFNADDFSLELVKDLKKKKYTRYIPKRDLRCGTKEWREDNKEMKSHYDESWNWWASPSGEIITAYQMFQKLNYEYRNSTTT